MAGGLTVIFTVLMLALIAKTWMRGSDRKDPCDWWKRGERPPWEV